MVLMAIDHVRVYRRGAAGGPDPAVFFTRWILTSVRRVCILRRHRCLSLWIKLGSPQALASYLFTRGFMLVISR